MTQHTFTVQQLRAMSDEDLQGVLDRLHQAETICVLFGWTGVNPGNERDDALTELWMRWIHTVGVDFAAPSENPELSDSVIADLAPARRDTRDETLRKLFGQEH